MADVAKDLLWLGIEDFTGLWDAAFTAQAADGPVPLESARDRARSVLESLLAEGLIDLYEFHGVPRDGAEAIALERRAALLHNDECWAAPEEEDDASVWFRTTEKGFELYCEKYNGGFGLYRRQHN
jgi:hypothetical protein